MIVWLHHSDGAAYQGAVSFISHQVWGQDLSMSQGTIMAVMRGDGMAGACLFHNYQPDYGVIELSAASDGHMGLTRFALRDIFGYVFDQMGCQAAVMRVDARNERMCAIASRIGFARHDIPRMRGRDVAEAVFVLGDTEWRGGKFYKGGRDGV